MTEAASSAEPSGAEGVAPRTAGALLKAAREREGLHLAVLAATIKVSPAKLQALEQDRYDQLPNATFTRALAQSVCRSLKIDPRPVLALLPQLESLPLEGAGARLNTPFHERPNRSDGAGLAWASKPMFWAGGLLLVAAIVVGVVPPTVIEDLASQIGLGAPAATSPVPAAASTSFGTVAVPVEPASAPASALADAQAPASTPDAPTPTAGPASSAVPVVAAPVASAAAPIPAAGVTAPALAASPVAPRPMGSGPLRLSASADSWIEVLDAQGQAVFSRILARGEAVAVDGAPPLRVRVGNAAGTSVAFRGQSYDLAPYTRDNVARFELR